MELIYRLADVRPKIQAIAVLLATIAGPIMQVIVSNTHAASLWPIIAALVLLGLLSPNMSRIAREAQTEIRWFISRTVFLNLAGIGFILMLGPAITGTSNATGQADSPTSTPMMWLMTLSLLVIVTSAISGLGYLLHTMGNKAKEIGAKRMLHQSIQEKLADGILDDQEFKELSDLTQKLGLTGEDLERARSVAFSKTIAPLLKEIRKTRRMNPGQEENLKALAKSHQITPEFGHSLLTFRQLWQIENTGQLELHPIAAPSIRLTKGEQCYVAVPAVWKQLKKRRVNTGYVGGSVGFRVAKGVTLRVGKAVPTYRETEQLETISTGRLFVTNKKLLFVGEKKSTNIVFGRLAGYEVARDAIQVNKISGSPDVFFLNTEDVEIVDAHLQVL